MNNIKTCTSDLPVPIKILYGKVTATIVCMFMCIYYAHVCLWCISVGTGVFDLRAHLDNSPEMDKLLGLMERSTEVTHVLLHNLKLALENNTHVRNHYCT